MAMQIPVPLGNEKIHNTAEGATQCIVFVVCPDCLMIAAAQWGDRLESTDGPVEHVRVACVNRHWFFMPADTFIERLQNY
ncbi:MAG: hypothetical protein ACRDS0_06215 [Pseudonocardiaceae bacterium]